MAEAVHAILMAGGILGDPLLVGAVAQHAEDDTTAAGCLHGFAGVGLGDGGCPPIESARVEASACRVVAS